MLPFVRGWTDVRRTARANVRLGAFLAFVAGALNAGAFLYVGFYTSHMTGLVSSIGDNVVLGHAGLVKLALAGVLCFVLGAMTTAILVNWGLRGGLHSAYGLPLVLESAVLAALAFAASAAGSAATACVLCFLMGLQNAVITKVSRAEIRTTHVTGLITDIGIELGKMVYVNTRAGAGEVRANAERLRIHSLLVAAFLAGSFVGAYGFVRVGMLCTLPFSAAILFVALRPVLRDVFPHA